MPKKQPKPARIIVDVEGGVVQAVRATRMPPNAVVKVRVIDVDSESVGEEVSDHTYTFKGKDVK